MNSGANVRSVESLEAFRANLVIYMSKANPTLDEISAEVMRIRVWLENDRRPYWETQMKKRLKILETAKQELFSATIANLRETSSAEIMAVRRAEKAVEEADTKLRVIKKWSRELDSVLTPLSKQLEKLQTVLSGDLPMAVAHLAEVIKTLDAYAGIKVPETPSGPTSTPAAT